MESEKKAEALTPDQQAAIAEAESAKLALAVDDLKIKNDDDLRAATEMLARVKLTSKNIGAQKDPIIKGLNSSVKRIRDLFRPTEDKLSQAESKLKRAILEYHEKVASRAAKKAEKIEAKVDSGELDMSSGMAKLANVKQAETMMHAPSGGAQVRVTRKIRITNVGELPPRYFMRERVIEALRLEVAEDVLRQKQPVPAGAELYEEKGIAAFNG